MEWTKEQLEELEKEAEKYSNSINDVGSIGYYGYINGIKTSPAISKIIEQEKRKAQIEILEKLKELKDNHSYFQGDNGVVILRLLTELKSKSKL